MIPKRTLGKIGEIESINYLNKLGYKILDWNVRTPYGEIDILAIQNKELVVVEVKTRSTSNFGRPMEAVGYTKIEHLSNAAEYYQKHHPELPQAVRIDVMEVYSQPKLEFNLITRVDQS